MTIRVKPIKSTKRVIVAMTKQVHIHRQAIENGLYVVGDLVGRRVKKLITEGPKTGRVYRILGRKHQASAPGQPPANMTGQLIKSYNYNVHGPFQMEVGEEAPHAGYLEDGTRRMKPRPHMIRAINETQGDVVRVFYDELDKVLKS